MSYLPLRINVFVGHKSHMFATLGTAPACVEPRNSTRVADVSLASHRIRQQKCVVGQELVLQAIAKRFEFWDGLTREVPNPLISWLVNILHAGSFLFNGFVRAFTWHARRV